MHATRSLVVGLFALAAACQNPGLEPVSDADPVLAEACQAEPLVEPTSIVTGGRASTDESRQAIARAAYAGAPAACPDQAAGPGTACGGALPGVYALRYDLDVYWQADAEPLPPPFDPGRGRVTLLFGAALSDFCAADGGGRAQLQLCSLQLPPLYVDASGAVTELSVSPTDVPRFAVRVQSEQERVRFAALVATAGIALAEPSAAWPSPAETGSFECGTGRSGPACFPDDDGDGEPGITARPQLQAALGELAYPRCAGWHRDAVPTRDPGLFEGGASELYLGVRAAMSGVFSLGSTCAGGDGRVEADDLLLRVLDCKLADGTRCTPAEAAYVDRNLPQLHTLREGDVPAARLHHARPDADARLDRSPSRGPTATAVRLANLGSEIDCAAVRDALQD